MREIKFRAWDIEKNKYVYDFWDTPYYVHRVICHYDIDVCEQFTGLKDKNGKEIYEGDIVKIIHNFTDGGFMCKVGVIVFRDCNFALTDKSTQMNYWMGSKQIKQCEIIGNIHENKELL